MGLFLGIIAAAVTCLGVALTIFADSMSDAPSVDGISPWPTAIIGFGIAGALVFTHYVPIHFNW